MSDADDAARLLAEIRKWAGKQGATGDDTGWIPVNSIRSSWYKLKPPPGDLNDAFKALTGLVPLDFHEPTNMVRIMGPTSEAEEEDVGEEE